MIVFWLPIDTAPKSDDGLRLLVFSPSLGTQIARYDGWGKGTGGFEFYDEDGFGEGFWCSMEDATHWMLLPEPPN